MNGEPDGAVRGYIHVVQRRDRWTDGSHAHAGTGDLTCAGMSRWLPYATSFFGCNLGLWWCRANLWHGRVSLLFLSFLLNGGRWMMIHTDYIYYLFVLMMHAYNWRLKASHIYFLHHRQTAACNVLMGTTALLPIASEVVMVARLVGRRGLRHPILIVHAWPTKKSCNSTASSQTHLHVHSALDYFSSPENFLPKQPTLHISYSQH